MARLELATTTGPVEREPAVVEQSQVAEVEMVVSATELGGVQRLQETCPHDLQREVQVGTPLVRGPRSMAIPYARKSTPTPASAVRKSARHSNGASAVSVLEKAKLLAADKNLENAKTVEKGTNFSVLDLLPDSHLTSVVKDSCVIFSPSVGSPGEALSIIRAKEQVQAALAATSRRLKLEAEAKKAAEAAAVSSPPVGLGNLGESAGSPGREPTHLGEEPPRATSEEDDGPLEREERELPPDSAPDGIEGEGNTSNTRRTVTKRRRKKSSLTVRKGASKRKGAL
jgi:hypothetical protein